MLKNTSCTTMMPAVDLARAKKFYEEILGFEPSTYQDEEGMLWYRCADGTNFGLYERSKTKADHTALAFKVDDLEAEMADLKQRGVKFEDYDIPEMGLKTENGVAIMSKTKTAWFLDTEGNILNIWQKI